MIRLDDKIAIVTGAEQSIGAAVAAGLHAAGATVVLTGIRDAEGAAAAAALGARASYRRVDVESDADIDACLEACRAAHGRLDILVNCACSYLDTGLATPRADWLRNLNVTVVGAAIFVQKAAPLMTRPGAVVINIGSVSGKFGNGNRGPYSVGKAGLMHFTRCAATALAPQGIRVLTVTPAWTWSPPMEPMTGGDRDLADRGGAFVHPLGRVGRMDEVANAVVFAASDAASWINGCDIPVDGGFSMLGPDQGKGPKYWIAQVDPDVR